MADRPEKRDLVLNPGEYAHLQENTRGIIKTFVGPTVVNQTAQDRAVKFDSGTRKYTEVNLEQAVVQQPLASEGDYIVLQHPAEDNKHPEEGSQAVSPRLKHGRKVNIPGPATFALWPGQNAQVIDGHNLRSNQYLVVRIYNDTEAKANWGKGVMKPVGGEEIDKISTQSLDELTIGKLLVIKGTEVSFYIPPTGVEVVPVSGSFVREAVTLERLEYCILVDEDGNKRFERGPKVVFPEPTENFYADRENNTVFPAIELNDIQGIHVKVIAPYKEGSNEYKEGDELFITGKECAIYFPRPEHSIITYGSDNKGTRKQHYAVAIPAGEARYVMNRSTGEIRTEKGPKMLLCDPRTEVIVRRILSQKQCEQWYPGNTEASAYNQNLRTVADPKGFVTESSFGAVAARDSSSRVQSALRSLAEPAMEEFNRGSTYTQPRQLTLNTKYEGVPAINVWTGYAVMVVNKRGGRRVEQGPCTVLLDYDESLELLELSTGKPKNTDTLLRTVYLRVANNKVSDIVDVETSDHVPCSVKLSFRVNFRADNSKWFDVDNYVKFLCDHVRSLLKGSVRKINIETFHANSVDIIRNIILGEKVEGHRQGMKFSENGMCVDDVEVLGVTISNDKISSMLANAQHSIIAGSITLNQAETNLKNTQRQEEINRLVSQAQFETKQSVYGLEKQAVAEELALKMAQIASDLKRQLDRKAVIEAEIANTELTHKNSLSREKELHDLQLVQDKSKMELELSELKANTEATVARFTSAQAGFSEALLALGNQDTMVKVAEALSVQNFIGGKSFVEVVQNIFNGSSIGPIMQSVIKKATERDGTPDSLTSRAIPSATR